MPACAQTVPGRLFFILKDIKTDFSPTNAHLPTSRIRMSMFLGTQLGTNHETAFTR